MERILIDTDVTLDFLSKRNGFYESANQLFSLLDLRKIEGFSTPVMFSNLHYILSGISGKTVVIDLLKKLRSKIKIISVFETHIDSALNSGFPDFEDAIQYFSALDQSIDFIITRNKKDFGKSSIPVMTAEEFIHYFKSISRN